MQLHQIKPTHSKKKPKRIGRGGKRGTYSGRGIKGQKARAGRGPYLGLAGGNIPLKKIPKKRGATGRTKKKIRRGSKIHLYRLKRQPLTINLSEISQNFKPGEVVSPRTLWEKKLINVSLSKYNLKKPDSLPVKILGRGKLKVKKLVFQNLQFSESVKAQIKKNQGIIK